MKVRILLSTYNGELFLRDQIASLQQQSFKDFEVLVRDDGSTDSTPQIISQTVQSDARFHLWSGTRENLGVVQSFARLLESSPDADVIFFCDQDDVWRKDKVEKTLGRFFLGRKDEPLAVHSDLALCNENLSIFQPSMKAQSRARRNEPHPVMPLLGQNFVTGCTLAINKSLAQKVLPIPPEALMHDWWIALVAASLGRLEFIPESLVLYRQHSHNASGPATSLSLRGGLKKFLSKRTNIELLMQRRFAQSLALERQLSRFAPNAPLFQLQKLHRAWRKDWLEGMRTAHRLGIELESPSRTLLYYFLLMTQRGQLRKLMGDSSPEKVLAP